MKIFTKVALLFGAAAVLAGCAKHDELNQPGNGSGSGNSVTITANASTSSNPDTKLGYNEGVSAMSFTWEDNGLIKESFSVLVQDGDGTPFKFEQTDEGGNRIGAFSGNVVAENGKKLYAVYPELAAGTYNPTAVKLDLSEQKLVSTAADLKHNKYHYMLSEATYNGSSEVDFSFTHKVSILKVELEFPAGTATEITELRLSGLNTDANLNVTTGVLDFTGLTASASTLKSDVGIALSSDKLTAYIYVFPQDLTGKELTLFAVGANGKSYKATFSGSNIGEGNVYTLAKTVTEVVVMSFTIDTRKNPDDATDKTFIAPFAGPLTGYSLTIDWGDGTNNTFTDGSTFDEANMTHTYPAAGEYTITIMSSEVDYAKEQMPSLKFGTNYTDVNYNSKKLISVNTPLLNMNREDMSSTFGYCSNLTTIPKGLFDKNTKVTDFSNCFSNCPSLTEILKLLFANNTEATDFSECFSYCTGLTEIPAGLFDKNTKVTTFNGCFSYSSGLTKIPELLFAKNTEVTNFGGCFGGCSGLTEIPAGLFDNNTAVTNFVSCFYNCTKAKLNSNIFCDENTQKSTRFDGKTMYFAGCFYNCGSDESITDGGTAPALWSYKMNVELTKWCFKGVTKVSNVGEIDPAWIN